MKLNRVTALLLGLVLAFSLAACGQGASSDSTASSSASSAAAEGKTEEQLLAEENEILSANDALWEKVFSSMDKNVTETTLSTNYGDFLLSAVEKTKDQFSDEEYKTLTADAEKIRDIENQIAALAPAEDAASGAAAQGTAFPQFEGSDLEGNPVDNSLFAGNAFTVVNFWFNGCKPCVEELDDLKAETILVIRGVSALDKELLGTLVAEAKDALETLEKQLVQAQEEYEEATKTAKRSNYICNELFTWADVYDTANHDERRAILQQFIKEIRVRKDYEISITLNASFNQVEQLKSVSIYDGAEIFEEISEKGA